MSNINTTYRVTSTTGISVDIETGRGVSGYKYVTIRPYWSGGDSPYPFMTTLNSHITAYDDPRKAALAAVLYKRQPEKYEAEIQSNFVSNGGKGQLALSIDWKEWGSIFDLPRFDNDPELLKLLRALQKADRAKRSGVTTRRKSKAAKAMSPNDVAKARRQAYLDAMPEWLRALAPDA